MQTCNYRMNMFLPTEAWLYLFGCMFCGPIKYEISLVACTMYFVCQANGILKYSFCFLCVGLGLCTKNKEGST